MASLIGWLADSGARKSDGAAVASGYAWFYQPGSTSTQVTVFSDADGLYAQTQPVRLDAGGRAEVWTTTAVELVIQDSTGATVRTQDRANTVAAAQVEVQNAGFTGTSLATGAQVAGGRTDIDTVLSRLVASLGSTDGNVNLNGSIRTVASAVWPLARVFDVTSAAYGAVGNDNTDATVPIQNAIAACVAAGGGFVYLPPGTYKLTGSLTVTAATVKIIGAGSSVTTLKQYANAATSISISGSACTIADISFTLNTAATSKFIACTSTCTLRVQDCSFDSSGGTGADGLITTKGTALLRACQFTHATSKVFILADGGSGSCTTVLCGSLRINFGLNFCYANTATNLTLACVQVNSPNAGAVNLLSNLHAGTAVYLGCAFLGNGGGSSIDISAPNTGGRAYEFGSILSPVDTSVAGGAGAGLNGSSWQQISANASNGAIASYSPSAGLYRYHHVTSTGAAFQWADPTGFSSVTGGGLKLELHYKNTNAGAVTPTFGATYKTSAAPAVASGSAAGWTFVFDTTIGAWVQLGSVTAYVC